MLVPSPRAPLRSLAIDHRCINRRERLLRAARRICTDHTSSEFSELLSIVASRAACTVTFRRRPWWLPGRTTVELTTPLAPDAAFEELNRALPQRGDGTDAR